MIYLAVGAGALLSVVVRHVGDFADFQVVLAGINGGEAVRGYLKLNSEAGR